MYTGIPKPLRSRKKYQREKKKNRLFSHFGMHDILVHIQDWNSIHAFGIGGKKSQVNSEHKSIANETGRNLII